MTKNKYVRLINNEEKGKTSIQVFKEFIEKHSSYKLNFWVMMKNWMNDLPVKDKIALKKEIEKKGFKNDNDIWHFLGY